VPLNSCLRARAAKATRIRAADRPKRGLELSCRRTLETWSAPDREQDQLRRHYLDHLARRTDGWSRSCVGAHLTASSLICAAAEGMVLLTLHGRLGRWLQTGGHIESTDPTLEAAATREAAEESGLADLSLEPSPLLLSKHEVPCGPVEPTYHLDVQYLVLANHPVSPGVGEESIDVRWFFHDQLPEVDHSVAALVRAAGIRLGWYAPDSLIN
jgi:8-oxo-dGTP pyrophosphatase MutT (NUDIX family)